MTAFPREALGGLLDRGMAELPDVPPEAREPLLDYLALLHRWNRVYNLSAVRDPAAMVTLHVLDSLVVLPWLRGRKLLDVGSGAGLPGLPLAICRPELAVTLLDSNSKKTRFLRQCVADLGLANVDVVHARVEDYRPDALFDCIISRAFARTDTFVNSSAGLMAAGGCLLAMKGRPDDDDPGGKAWQSKTMALAVPGLDAARTLVRIEAATI